jgi:hypothetical protein
MPKNDSNGTGKSEKRGYRPLNVGYSAEEERGYSPKSQGTNLPKPPRGGTGESSKSANPGTAESGKK